MIEDTFKAADATLATLNALRRDLARAIGAPAPAVGDTTSAIDLLLELQRRADVAASSIPCHEEALRAVQRALVIANDEAAFAERDAKLRDLASNRERIAIMREEAAARVETMRKTLVDEADRQYALEKRADLVELLKRIEAMGQLEREFVAILEAAQRASDIRYALSVRHDANPNVAELRFWPSEVDEPLAALRRLATEHIGWQPPKPRAPINIPGYGVI